MKHSLIKSLVVSYKVFLFEKNRESFLCWLHCNGLKDIQTEELQKSEKICKSYTNSYPVSIYLFKVDNGNSRILCDVSRSGYCY